MHYRKIETLISEALEIEEQEALAAGSIGFMARALTMATLPHSKPATNEFSRTNGSLSMTMLAPSKTGLPYGAIPRLLLSWMTTEAVRTKERELHLGDSMTSFMHELGLVPTGGRWGSITRLKMQTKKLLCTSVHCGNSGEHTNCTVHQGLSFTIIDEYTTSSWWDPKDPAQQTFFDCTLTLGERFFEEIIKNPVPIDMRALRALKQSSMALDIYMWLTYRMSYLSKPTVIPWRGLQAQFGSGYPLNSRGAADFKRNFLIHLKKVLVVYPNAKVGAADRGLALKPSKTHVRKATDKTIEFKPNCG